MNLLLLLFALANIIAFVWLNVHSMVAERELLPPHRVQPPAIYLLSELPKQERVEAELKLGVLPPQVGTSPALAEKSAPPVITAALPPLTDALTTQPAAVEIAPSPVLAIPPPPPATESHSVNAEMLPQPLLDLSSLLPPSTATEIAPPAMTEAAPSPLPPDLPASAPVSPLLSCYRSVNTLSEPQLAAMKKQLMPLHLGEIDEMASAEELIRYWILLPSDQVGLEWRSVMAQLEERGVTDIAYLNTGDFRGAISLGLYSMPTAAQRRLEQVNPLLKGIGEAVVELRRTHRPALRLTLKSDRNLAELERETVRRLAKWEVESPFWEAVRLDSRCKSPHF